MASLTEREREVLLLEFEDDNWGTFEPDWYYNKFGETFHFDDVEPRREIGKRYNTSLEEQKYFRRYAEIKPKKHYVLDKKILKLFNGGLFSGR